jgi:hypothetical protein
MTVQLDSFTIKDFESRYGVARSNIYNRINGLKEKGYPMEAEKQSGKSIFNAGQVAVMDALDAHLKADNDIASFPAVAGHESLATVLQDKPQPSRRTQDTPTFGLTDFPEAIALRVATLLQPPPLTDPFANLKALEEAAQRGWLLSSSQLAPLLGLKTLAGQTIDRYGFTCTRQGRNGVESAWKITKTST